MQVHVYFNTDTCEFVKFEAMSSFIYLMSTEFDAINRVNFPKTLIYQILSGNL